MVFIITKVFTYVLDVVVVIDSVMLVLIYSYRIDDYFDERHGVLWKDEDVDERIGWQDNVIFVGMVRRNSSNHDVAWRHFVVGLPYYEILIVLISNLEIIGQDEVVIRRPCKNLLLSKGNASMA